MGQLVRKNKGLPGVFSEKWFDFYARSNVDTTVTEKNLLKYRRLGEYVILEAQRYDTYF